MDVRIVHRWSEGHTMSPPGIVMSQELASHETKTACKLCMQINMQFSLPAGLTTAGAQANMDNTVGSSCTNVAFCAFYSLA